MPLRVTGYRASHQSESVAAEYDEGIYAPESSASLLWRIEAEILDRIVMDFRRERGPIDYLDFACGAGRILARITPFARHATGIDISRAMLKRAARKVPSARLILRDVTVGDAPPEGRYDLITCFRFLTNAEPELRIAGLRQMALRLRDDNSLLIVNIHGNLWSYRLFLWPYYRLKKRLTGMLGRNYLSRRQTRKLLEEAGISVQAVVGLHFIPEKLQRYLPGGLVYRLERCLAGTPVVHAFGANQIFLCSKGRRKG